MRKTRKTITQDVRVCRLAKSSWNHGLVLQKLTYTERQQKDNTPKGNEMEMLTSMRFKIFNIHFSTGKYEITEDINGAFKKPKATKQSD